MPALPCLSVAWFLALSAADPAGPPPAPPALVIPERQHVDVYRQPGRYGGWPANGGAWAWGDEMLVGFTAGWYKPTKDGHAIDRQKPIEKRQARSLDGGQTWTIENPPALAKGLAECRPLERPLDFMHPDFALVFHFGSLHKGPSWFLASTDRGRSWQGPYRFAVEGIDDVSTRTDYVVLGQRECLMFGSAAKANGKEGRPFCARTTDGGLTWKLVGTIGPEPEGFAIMPSTLRLDGGGLLTTVRLGNPSGNGIAVWRSDDGGRAWTRLADATGDIGGNPPSMVRLKDGRICLTYGHRRRPFGARARITADEGRTWSAEIVLRENGRNGDLGYPRSLVRPDGKVVTVYYYNGPRDEDRTIEATIWTPPAAKVLAEAGPPRISPITNGAVLRNGRAVALPATAEPAVETVRVYQPTTEWSYSHHPSITHFKGRFHAIWSNGRIDEDAPGQRVLWSTSADFRHWTPPRPLVDSVTEVGVERVLTAAGFHQHEGTLVAYFSNYGPKKETTRLEAVTTTDGQAWSPVRQIGLPICPNHGPQRLASGRLVISGNTAYPYSDDPTGLAGWRMTGIYPRDGRPFKDDPVTFHDVAHELGWPADLCEGAFYQTDDGRLHMLLRNTSPLYPGRLWVTESRDDGVTWSEPAMTAFSDSNAKFHFGRLPDRRFYYVGNSIAGNRWPLVLSLSGDGVRFDRHWLIGREHYQMRQRGQHKGGEYGYPHSMVHDGHLYAIASRQKEAVDVVRVALTELKP